MPKFESFPEAVQEVPGFVAVVEEGSRILREPQQPDRSRHHLYVVTEDMSFATRERVGQTLSEYPLGDDVTVAHRSYEDFTHGTTSRDLSLRFRSKTIAGHDVIADKRVLRRELALNIGKAGIAALNISLQDQLLNTANWSEQRTKSEAYDGLKSFFDNASAFYYGLGETYPLRRDAVTSHMPNITTGRHILDIMYHIDELPMDETQKALYLSIGTTDAMLKQLP